MYHNLCYSLYRAREDARRVRQLNPTWLEPAGTPETALSLLIFITGDISYFDAP